MSGPVPAPGDGGPGLLALHAESLRLESSESTYEAVCLCAQAHRKLANALAAAAWGLQRDGSWVCRGTGFPGDPWAELHAPGRRGVLAEVALRQTGNELTRLRSPARAWALRVREREERRREQREYRTRLMAAATALEGGATLLHYDGQQGGVFAWDDGFVSAPGALRQIGIRLEQDGQMMVGGRCVGRLPAKALRFRLPVAALAEVV